MTRLHRPAQRLHTIADVAGFVPGRDDGDILIPQKARAFDHEAHVLVNLVLLINAQRDRDVGPLRPERHFGYGADLHAGHEHLGARFQASRIVRVQP